VDEHEGPLVAEQTAQHGEETFLETEASRRQVVAQLMKIGAVSLAVAIGSGASLAPLRFGLSDGDEAVVESPNGKTRAKIKTSKRMHPDVVGLQHGFGHWALGKDAEGRGTADGVLRPVKADPLSGQALHKETCVRISRA